MRQSYFCFDKRYMIDGLDSVEKEPIIKRFWLLNLMLKEL
jgi:hypothetical protein